MNNLDDDEELTRTYFNFHEFLNLSLSLIVKSPRNVLNRPNFGRFFINKLKNTFCLFRYKC